MRLLIIGALEGQLSTATKMAMDGGAKVAHAPSVEIALASLRAGKGADLLLVDVMMDIAGLIAAPCRWWPVALKPTQRQPLTPFAPAPRNISRCRPMQS